MNEFKALLNPKSVVALYRKHKARPIHVYINKEQRFCPLGIVAYELLEDKSFVGLNSDILWEVVKKYLTEDEYKSFYRTIDKKGCIPSDVFNFNMATLAKDIYDEVLVEIGWPDKR